MGRFLIRRLVTGLVVVWLASVLVFMLSRMSGDPRYLYLSEYTTKEQWDAWGTAMGLDKPYPVQYAVWLSKAVRLDFGRSLQYQVNAVQVVPRRIRATLELAAGAYVFALLLGVPLGVFSAVSRGSGWDLLGRGVALLGQAMPGFWLGIMLILIFAVQLHWLPVSGREGWQYHVLPSVTLGWFPAAALLRLIRSSLLEVLDSEYIKFAKAKGVSSWAVIWKHALKNAMIVPLTYAGILLAAFMTGAVVTETVFAWPGLGRLAAQAVFTNDFPVISVLVMLFTSGYVLLNLLVDLGYSILDPRIRHGR